VADGINVTFTTAGGGRGIVPWNFPMPIAGWGFAPAWQRATTVVLKRPSAHLTAIRLAELALEAGCPMTVSVLPGKGSVVGQRLRRSRRRRQDRLTGKRGR